MFQVDKSLNYGRNEIFNLLKLVPQVHSALDVGAGRGDDLELVRSLNPNALLYGVEYYEENAKELEGRGIKTFKINFEKEQLPVKGGCLDLIISNQMMEHSKEVFWVLHEMSRTLKVGGHLLIGVPNLASLHNRLLLLMGKQPTNIQNNSAHLRGYTKNDLLKLIDVFAKGYEVVSFRGSNFYPFSPWIAKPLAKAIPSMAYSLFLLLRKTKDYKQEYLKYPVDRQLETNFYLGDQ